MLGRGPSALKLSIAVLTLFSPFETHVRVAYFGHLLFNFVLVQCFWFCFSPPSGVVVTGVVPKRGNNKELDLSQVGRIKKLAFEPPSELNLPRYLAYLRRPIGRIGKQIGIRTANLGLPRYGQSPAPSLSVTPDLS